jgi:hypothetical protein
MGKKSTARTKAAYESVSSAPLPHDPSRYSSRKILLYDSQDVLTLGTWIRERIAIERQQYEEFLREGSNAIVKDVEIKITVSLDGRAQTVDFSTWISEGHSAIKDKIWNDDESNP